MFWVLGWVLPSKCRQIELKESRTKDSLTASGTQGSFGICFVWPYSNDNDVECGFCSPGCESLNKFLLSLGFTYFKKFPSRFMISNRSQKLYIVSTETKTVIKTLSIREIGGEWGWDMVLWNDFSFHYFKCKTPGSCVCWPTVSCAPECHLTDKSGMWEFQPEQTISTDLGTFKEMQRGIAGEMIVYVEKICLNSQIRGIVKRWR